MGGADGGRGVMQMLELFLSFEVSVVIHQCVTFHNFLFRMNFNLMGGGGISPNSISSVQHVINKLTQLDLRFCKMRG